jgi:hypothetical protein
MLVHVIFVVYTVEVEQAVYNEFSLPLSVIPAVLHTRLHLGLALTSTTNERNLGTFQKAIFFRKAGSAG